MIAPKTMPSFACCAMQCAYVLLSVYNKTQTAYPEAGASPGSVLVSDLLSRLQQGLLSTLATLENYGTAFEALGGMRGQSVYKTTRTTACSQVSRSNTGEGLLVAAILTGGCSLSGGTLESLTRHDLARPLDARGTYDLTMMYSPRHPRSFTNE